MADSDLIFTSQKSQNGERYEGPKTASLNDEESNQQVFILRELQHHNQKQDLNFNEEELEVDPKRLESVTRLLHQNVTIVEDEQIISFPDGGADAWLAVFGSWLVHTVVIGIPATFGVFQQYYAANPDSYEGPHNSSSIAIIGSVLNCLLGLFAIPAGRLAEVFGNRLMAVIGGLSVGLSLLLASFAQTYWQLLLTQGVLFGIACPIAYFPALTIISHYFDKRKGLATGLAVSGSGIGGLAISPIVRYLLSNYGSKSTLLYLSLGGTLIILFASIFLKPRLRPSARGKMNYWKVAKDNRFIRLFLIAAISSLGYYVPFFYVSQFAVYHGMSVGQGAILIGLINGSSGFGRIMLGLNSDIFGQLNTLWVCLSLAASSILLIWPLSTNFGGLIFFSLMYGFFAGGFISLLPTCIVQLFGTKDIGTITGMVYTGFFFGNLCGPPLSGAMIDALTTVDPSTGLQMINYIPSIIFSGVCILTASLILLSTKIKISNGVFFEKI